MFQRLYDPSHEKFTRPRAGDELTMHLGSKRARFYRPAKNDELYGLRWDGQEVFELPFIRSRDDFQAFAEVLACTHALDVDRAQNGLRGMLTVQFRSPPTIFANDEYV